MAKQFKDLSKKNNIPNVVNSAKAQKFVNGATGDYENIENHINKQVKNKGAAKQVGRPKLSDEEKIKLSLYVSKSQNDFISSTASGLGMSKNNYILYMLFNKESVFSNDDMEKLLVCARKKGVTLNKYIRTELKLDAPNNK